MQMISLWLASNLLFLSFFEIFTAMKLEFTLDVLAAELLHDLGREDPRREGAPEDGVELGVEAADAHLAEVPVRIDDGLADDL